MMHELKILPKYYAAVWLGDKRFELRKNDRNYQEGDILLLREWDGKGYTGRYFSKFVDYVLESTEENDLSEYGLKKGFCILGLRPGWFMRIPEAGEAFKLTTENAEQYMGKCLWELELGRKLRPITVALVQGKYMRRYLITEVYTPIPEPNEKYSPSKIELVAPGLEELLPLYRIGRINGEYLAAYIEKRYLRTEPNEGLKGGGIT